MMRETAPLQGLALLVANWSSDVRFCYMALCSILRDFPDVRVVGEAQW